MCVTLMSKNSAITASHCIPQNTKVGNTLTLFDQHNRSYEARLISQDKKIDLAVLQLKEGMFEVNPLPLELCTAGTSYFALVSYIRINFENYAQLFEISGICFR